MTITWDNSGWAYEKGPCSRSNCEINPCSGHCKVRRPEHDRPPPVAWIAAQLWNDRETWTGPADIAAVLAHAPVAQPLTDEQINDEAWRVEAVKEYEPYTGSPRLKVEGLHDFAHAIAAKLHASTTPAPVAQGEPVATLHADGHWTHPPGRDPLDQFSGKVKLDVYAAAPAPVALVHKHGDPETGDQGEPGTIDPHSGDWHPLTDAPTPVLTPAQQHADEMRAALSSIAYGLELARIWGGMKWEYYPLHPMRYLPLRDKARAILAAIEATGQEGGAA